MTFAAAWPLQPERYVNERYEITPPTTWAIDLASITAIGYLPEDAGTEQIVSADGPWTVEATPPAGLDVVTNDIAFTWGGDLYFSRAGAVFRGFHAGSGVTANVGSADSAGRIQVTGVPSGSANAVAWQNIAQDRSGGLDIYGGIFRMPTAPIQAGAFQLVSGERIGTANSGGVLSGEFQGAVDSVRGIVGWAVADLGEAAGEAVRADELTYNAIYLQYVPLDLELLGVDTAGLPIDGKVPIYWAGGHVLVHHTDTTALPNPIVKDTAYELGRQRVAGVVLRDAVGTRLPGNLFQVNRSLGTVTIPTASDISTYALPITAHHRVQDELQVQTADISGRLDFTGALTHDYPVPGTYVSTKIRQGDKFARAFGYHERATWLSNWDGTLAGNQIAAQFDSVNNPIVVTNRGCITERWAAIVTVANSQVNIIGEGVGQILTNALIGAAIAPINPQTGVPYFSLPSAGWGAGWSVGTVLLFETQAAGGPIWVSRAVQPGGTEVLDDSATIGYIVEVNEEAPA